MAEEDMGFPCLFNDTISDTNRKTALVFIAIVYTQPGTTTARPKTTYLQKPRILPLLHALLDKLQRLLEILHINGILDLVIAPLEDGVVGGRHHGEVGVGLGALYMRFIHRLVRKLRGNNRKRVFVCCDGAQHTRANGELKALWRGSRYSDLRCFFVGGE